MRAATTSLSPWLSYLLLAGTLSRGPLNEVIPVWGTLHLAPRFLVINAHVGGFPKTFPASMTAGRELDRQLPRLLLGQVRAPTRRDGLPERRQSHGAARVAVGRRPGLDVNFCDRQACAGSDHVKWGHVQSTILMRR